MGIRQAWGVRHQQPLRLPLELAGRLRETARRKGISINDYAQFAIEAKLDADDEARRQRLMDRRFLQREVDSAAPRGLGLRPIAAPAPAPAPPVAEPQPVVVNVGGGTTSTGPDDPLIKRLAIFVANGPAFEREKRRRTAEDMLKASCSGDEARAEAQRLRAAIEERLKPTSARSWTIKELFR